MNKSKLENGEVIKAFRKSLIIHFNNAFEDGEDGAELRNENLAKEYTKSVLKVFNKLITNALNQHCACIFRKQKNEKDKGTLVESCKFHSDALNQQREAIINEVIQMKKSVLDLFPGTDIKNPTSELGDKVLCKEYYNKALNEFLTKLEK